MAARDCPTTRVLQFLGKKWVMLIIHTLAQGQGPMRFCQLQDAVGQANSTTLSSRLKELEDEGVISRKIVEHIPPWVEYKLTPKGEALWAAISSIEKWAQEWNA